ncbi:hypothetical protein HY68_36460 [Streptomyces sp. AcH 505]|uniref:hypothetical protein n=1 Tax=Streptomyces sp. AcH 505 TaxID=352211 RepID=UPI000591AB6D|nr:hypothetical protein HY68_36460 [Streptomyces sp. AcH 505]
MRKTSRAMPVCLVHCDTLLDPALTPTSRLLYAVLQASVETSDDVDMERVALLVGVADEESLKPFIAELSTAGVVECVDHKNVGPAISVHQMPVVPEQRTHVCVPCEVCGECSCEYMRGICRGCDEIRRAEAQGKADVARWQGHLDAGATYAISQNGARLHRWDCSTLTTPEKSWAFFEASKAGAEHGGVNWQRLPALFTAEELRAKGSRKKHCAVCGPDPL